VGAQRPSSSTLSGSTFQVLPPGSASR
jgi:hypothetical protein